MITEEKRKQVKKQLRRGEPEGEIKNMLRKDGYTEDEINALFYDLFPHKEHSGVNRNSKGQIFGLLGAGLLITGVSLLAIPIWLSEYAVLCIVLGVTGICVRYFVANQDQENRS